MAQDDTVTFESNHASFSAFTYVLRLTSPNNEFRGAASTVTKTSYYTNVVEG